MRATVRAHSLEVSTSSAATIQSGPFLALPGRPDPGKMANLALRAPRYSARGRRPVDPEGPAGADEVAPAGSVFMPIADSSPASKDSGTRVRSDGQEITGAP